MRLIKPSYIILPQDRGLDGIYKQIEKCGRTCYKSESSIKEGSAKPFVDRLISSKHFAMLEHGTVYLFADTVADGADLAKRYRENKYSEVVQVENECYITTNYRVVVENGWQEDLNYICEPTKCHKRRVTVRFVTQIAVSREANRHRVNSIAEQSTRYCNFSKGKFGGGITVNVPSWVEKENTEYIEFTEDAFYSLHNGIGEYRKWHPVVKWWFANKVCEKMYLSLIEDDGLKPQDARAVLPLDTNTELVHTAFVSDWQHFFDLRSHGTTGKPHPDIEVLATPLQEGFKSQKLI